MSDDAYFYVVTNDRFDHYIGHTVYQIDEDKVAAWCGIVRPRSEVRIIDDLDNVFLWCSGCVDARADEFSHRERRKNIVISDD